MKKFNNQRIVRGKVLQFLYISYPYPVMEETLTFSFAEVGILPDEVKRSLQYLVDKGYVEKDEKKLVEIRNQTVNLYKLTPTGIELMDGVIEDKAILLGE